MTYSVELCVGEFILAIVFNVRDGWIDMLITWKAICVYTLFSKHHYISSYNFNSWHSFGD